MRANKVMGIIFSNVHDDLIKELTERRSMGSVPFGGRYRLIDFPLSNLVNAGISKVGIITQSNYQSLMDHIGSGRPWDLDRKMGGLFFLPPYGNSESSGVYTGHIDALNNKMDFLKNSTEQYIVLCDADVVCNISIEDMIKSHISTGADVSIAYKHGRLPANHRDIMSFEFNNVGRITDIELSSKKSEQCDFSLDIIVVERNLLIHLVESAAAKSYTNLARDVFQKQMDSLKIFGWQVIDYAAVMDSTKTYAKASMDLLKPEIRSDLFKMERPVYTKTRDDMPTKYGLNSNVSNSVIADGCEILGQVKNCILFRGVKVGKNAVIENCIIMQDCVVGDNVNLKYVTCDKNVRISDGQELKGAETYALFINKGATV